ncbi:MAG: O-methyltransferase [Cytophagales bacterium]|nr:MAG: O-methyltransferase [Cytophagales bacterium]TAF60080.1 MAG: O-methyltransferase [Cytophagales bacterium]
MDFLPLAIATYAEAYSTPESAVLHALNRRTHLQVTKPRMLSGHLQGNVLATFSLMMRPRRILEIGTYTAYSAICLAQGLTEDGILHSIDNNEELLAMNQASIEEAKLGHKIQLHIGQAANIIPTLVESWDMVFIDADKTNYSLYFDLIIDKLRPGGLLIADNVLWSGKVTEPLAASDKDTAAILAFNEKVQTDSRVFNTLLPVRDGLMLAYKL